MSEQQKDTGSDLVTRLAIITSVIFVFLSKNIWRGAIHKDTWTLFMAKFWIFYFFTVAILAYSPGWDIPRTIDQFSLLFPHGLGQWIYLHLPRNVQFIVFTFAPLLSWLAIRGAWLNIVNRPYEKALAHLGLKNPTGEMLKVIDVVEINDDQRKVIVKAAGFDLQDIRNKKAILESALNVIVQEIRLAHNNRQFVEIIVSDKDLPTMVKFEAAAEQLTTPYSFLVGFGINGLIQANLQKVRHMIVAGGTGYGKSVFVKQFLIGILKSSEHLQIYMLDLKMGLEAKAFEPLKNVFIAKETISAIETMNAVVNEMERRFKYLERRGFTEIECKRDKMDRIVLLVDEASELFTVVKSSKEVKEAAIDARELSDKVAKLGRAAGIHLILATQKVVKETIDTRTQTNINARMIFRMNTNASSVNVLGTRDALDLPEIQGRGIWSVGDKNLLVQTPNLSNEEVTNHVKKLTEKFNGSSSPLLQPMLLDEGSFSNGDDEETEDDSENSNSTEVLPF